MRLPHLLFPIFLFYLVPAAAQRPSSPYTNKYFSAQRFDHFHGATRMTMVRELQDNDWQFMDSTAFSRDEEGVLRQGSTIDLAPYVNEDGYIVYWVPEVAPIYPGGDQALQRYVSDVAFPHKLNVERGRHSQVSVRCSIGTDGQVNDVAEAIPHREWIPQDVVDYCLDAVRYMPPWTPGLFNGKPVRVNRLILFALSE